MSYKTRGNYSTGGFGENKIKVMSNAERRKQGLEQDPDLEDYKPEEQTHDSE